MSNYSSYKHSGSGEGIAIIMTEHGIGDDIMALPAVTELCKNNDVTIFSRPFTKDIWPCKVYPAWDKDEGCLVQHGAFIGNTYEGTREVFEFKKRYKTIYHLNSWSTFESDRDGVVTRNPIHLIAELLETRVNSFFSWGDYLQPVYNGSQHVLFAPESVNPFRSLTDIDTKERELREFYPNLIRIGKGGYMAETFAELVNIVYNSELVITADNGVMNIARALGIATITCFGLSDETLSNQYEEFTDAPFANIRKTVTGCTAPCNNRADRGLMDGKCQGQFDTAHCQTLITTNDILQATETLWQSKYTLVT